MSKLLTVMPTRGILFTKAVEAWEREIADNGLTASVLRTDGVPLPDSRNLLVEAALELPDWRFLLFLDDDVVLPEGAVKAMTDTLTKGEGIDVAVIDYPHHSTPFSGERLGVATYEDWKPGDPVEGKRLAWAGLGCVMVKRRIFDRLEKPWFVNTAHRYARGTDGRLMMDGASRQAFGASSGEDVHFFFQCRKHGIKAAVIPGMVAGHCRIERFVYRLAGGKYSQSHGIEVNDRIDRPGV